MKSIDMTQGKVTPLLIKFAIPLMLGDLFQQLYIAVDSAIVGRYAGDISLAAVGANTFLIRLIIGLFVGISAGASVVIAHCVGAKEDKKLKDAVHTMAGLTLVGGIALSIFGILVANTLLHCVSTPADIMDEASAYLKIYMAGAMFELIYNVGSGILRSFGDSKRPFIYLVIASVVNIVLDFVFVAVLKMGAKGAAIATVISFFVCAVAVIYSMVTTTEAFRIDVKKIRIDKYIVPEVLKMGLPAGIQSMIVALSNVIIQAHINAMGKEMVAGFGVFNKVDGILMLPGPAIAMATMTFVGQNYGAGKGKRILEGIKAMCILETIVWAVGFAICMVFGDKIFYIFSSDELVVYYAKLTMYFDIPFYLALDIGYAMSCVIRAMGHSREASILFITGMCFIRQGWILLAIKIGLGIYGVLASYPISWIITVLTFFGYTLYLSKKGEFRDSECVDSGEEMIEELA